MDPQKIIATVEMGQPVRIEVQGVKGDGCKALTAPLVAALGGDVVRDDPTAGMYEKPAEARVEQDVKAGQ